MYSCTLAQSNDLAPGLVISRGRANLGNVTSEETPSPFLYQPDPDKPSWIQAKGNRLERRAPGEYFIVGRTHDGRTAEARVVPMTFTMRGI